MHEEGSNSPLTLLRSRILVLEGFGASLSVEFGCLKVRTGTGSRVRTLIIERASRPPLRRVVLIGSRQGGYLSVAALRWILDQRASFTWIDREGEVLMTSSALGSDDARLRRGQAAALDTGVGLQIVCDLVSAKIERQADVVAGSFSTARHLVPLIREQVLGARAARTPSEAMVAEARAADLYWQAWQRAGVTFTFPRREIAKIPSRWQRFISRGSPIANGPRMATDPVNACLNLAYSLVESETRLGLAAVGLDPGFGFGLHSDQINRANAALDVMEPVRPVADQLVLDLVSGHTFTHRDFPESPSGAVRVGPVLASALVSAWVPKIAEAVAPVVENVAQVLASDAGLGRRPTSLTQAARSAGRAGRRRRAPQPPTTSKRIVERSLGKRCRSCGEPVGRVSRTYCDGCVPEIQAEQHTAFAASGPARLASLREREGGYPVQRAEVRERIGRAQSERRLADLAWDAEHPEGADPAGFERLVPGLQALPLRAIAEATGLSLTAARAIRGGKAPHPRHWEALRRVSPGS